jgi:SAM-dependent methyltransferase
MRLSSREQAISYSMLADEYYDRQRHPTCANFEELSHRFLLTQLGGLVDSRLRMLEVGAGKSIVASCLAEMGVALETLIISDSSREMLRHSQPWKSRGATLLVMDGRRCSFATGTMDAVFSSLGDPYNTREFWDEVGRILVPGGTCLFTTPAYEWARDFRNNGEKDVAEFLLAKKSLVYVPSYVPSLAQQIEMISRAGLETREIADFRVSDLAGTVSPKLNVRNRSDSIILKGFRAVKKSTSVPR